MKTWLGVAVLFGSVVAAVTTLRAADVQHQTRRQQLDWAYRTDPPPDVDDDGKFYSLEGSSRTFKLNEIRARFDNSDSPARTTPADWFPDDHPPMPKIVAEGDPARGIVACALCHYPNGKGRSENAGTAGLPKDYMIETMHDMRVGLRKSADARKVNVWQMLDFTKTMTEEEIITAASYFASIPWTPWIRVVETNVVPKTRNANGLYLRLEGAEAGSEPIGKRIVEAAEDNYHTETLRNPRSGFVAYVPVGALAKGKNLVRTGGGKTLKCALCHGGDLHGIGLVPDIAARSPSYIVRQLFDIQVGARKVRMNPLMKSVVVQLTPDDMIAIAAYLASLPPPSTSAAANAAPISVAQRP